MNILYFGTSPFAIPALQELVTHGHEVVAVVTQPDRPSGRGGKVAAPPVKEEAMRLGLPVLQPESCRDPEFIETVRALAPELSVVAAYGQFLPDALRTLPRLGTVNLHGSLLPKLRGAAPIQRAIWNGEERTGVCLMWMARAMDAGDLIACAEEAILPTDTAGTLMARLAERAAELLTTWLPAIADGSAPHLPQDEEAVTFAPIIRKEERIIDWTQPATAIWRQVRALAPAPTAVTTFRGQPVKMLDVQPIERNSQPQEGIPGIIVEMSNKIGLVVETGNGFIQVHSLQPAGKRPMSGAEFIRGYRPAAGEYFS